MDCVSAFDFFCHEFVMFCILHCVSLWCEEPNVSSHAGNKKKFAATSKNEDCRKTFIYESRETSVMSFLFNFILNKNPTTNLKININELKL